MVDREKVINALELCTSKIETRTQVPCETCPYHNRKYHGVLGDGCCNARSLQRDALALLKAQEPRVMTLEEAKSASGYVVVQSRSCNILELQLIKDGFAYDSITVPTAVDDLWWEGYNKHWRLWTSVPSDEQREATQWMI